MRLTKRLERVEAHRAGGVVGDVALVWSAHEVRVDAARLVRGEMIAADVELYGMGDGCVWIQRIRERTTRDFEDLGRVRLRRGGAAGVEVVDVGRVVRVSGDLVEWVFDAGQDADAIAAELAVVDDARVEAWAGPLA